MNNKIIIFEGLPGSGKTEHIKKFSEDMGFTIMSEILTPDDAWLKAKKHEDQNYFWLNDKFKLEKGLESYKTALLDRGPISTLAYNYSKYIMQGDMEYFRLMGDYCANIAPTLIDKVIYIFLDIKDINLSNHRKNRGYQLNNPWRDISYLKVINNYYKYHFKLFEVFNNVHTISAERSFDDVHKKISRVISEYSKT